jgi:hypothetical protein
MQRTPSADKQFNVNYRELFEIFKGDFPAVPMEKKQTLAHFSFLGLASAMSNWTTAIVVLPPITYAFIHRIRIEEKVLGEAFGEDYVQYCRNTWALLPWIY